ncbi:Holliday junction DNA helicase [Klebsiella pneumoniae]|uniref:Replication-associated recombination protein A n=1 Tax=Klebsiella pneumoniae TaxID=573 RepID=A0A377XRI8_KLEPN|nr:Holliday junction DNA helicase [Klebsiella pneumoniae]
MPDETRRAIAELVNGDARRALNTLEMMADMAESDDSGKRVLKAELLTEIAGERSARFDNKGDRFYDLISALHKSVRGSAPDAALYWYARIITAGGDPLYVARRCLAIASEDVGNADPRAMQVAISAWDCFNPRRAGGRRTGDCPGHCLSGLRAEKQRGVHRLQSGAGRRAGSP